MFGGQEAQRTVWIGNLSTFQGAYLYFVTSFSNILWKTSGVVNCSESWSAVWAGLVSRAEDHKLCVKLTRKCATSPQWTARCAMHGPAQPLSRQLLIQTHSQSWSDCDQSIVMVASTDQRDTVLDLKANIHHPGCPSLIFFVQHRDCYSNSSSGTKLRLLPKHPRLPTSFLLNTSDWTQNFTVGTINTYQVSIQKLIQMNDWLHIKTLHICEAFFLLKESSSFPLSLFFVLIFVFMVFYYCRVCSIQSETPWGNSFCEIAL